MGEVHLKRMWPEIYATSGYVRAQGPLLIRSKWPITHNTIQFDRKFYEQMAELRDGDDILVNDGHSILSSYSFQVELSMAYVYQCIRSYPRIKFDVYEENVLHPLESGKRIVHIRGAEDEWKNSLAFTISKVKIGGKVNIPIWQFKQAELTQAIPWYERGEQDGCVDRSLVTMTSFERYGVDGKMFKRVTWPSLGTYHESHYNIVMDYYENEYGLQRGTSIETYNTPEEINGALEAQLICALHLYMRRKYGEYVDYVISEMNKTRREYGDILPLAYVKPQGQARARVIPIWNDALLPVLEETPQSSTTNTGTNQNKFYGTIV
jgi:hypothetical protein